LATTDYSEERVKLLFAGDDISSIPQSNTKHSIQQISYYVLNEKQLGLSHHVLSRQLNLTPCLLMRLECHLQQYNIVTATGRLSKNI